MCGLPSASQGASLKPNWIERTILVRVGRHHFAFLRGYLEGLDLRALSARYLETDSGDKDLRAAKSTLKWIIGQLMVAARRTGHYADARVIRITPERLKSAPPPEVPTIDEFRESEGLDDFSHEDVMEFFMQKFGDVTVDRRSVRNDRLRRRQLQALAMLESLVVADPNAHDLISGWLHPSPAARLAAAGAHTIAELVERINTQGYRWWRDVPQFGQKAAAQVAGWLQRPEVVQSIGMTLRPQSLMSPTEWRERRGPRKRQTGIVPLEYFLAPAELDGANGTNRGTRCTIRAHTDHEAILAWLTMLRDDTRTRLSYRAAAERFLLWAVLERKQPLSSLTPEDCIAFRRFLERLDPATDAVHGPWPYNIPRDRWIRAGTLSREDDDWRPFEGPLDLKSRKLCFVILKRLCNWLVKVHYLHSNPWEAVPAMKEVEFSVDPTRSLSPPLMRFLVRHMETLERGPHYERVRFVFRLAYATGLRLSELVKVKLSDLERVPLAYGDRDGWHLKVIGKRGVERKVPVPTVILFELDRYLLGRGLEIRAACPREKLGQTYLVGRICPPERPSINVLQLVDQHGKNVEIMADEASARLAAAAAKDEADRRAGISARSLYGLLKTFFESGGDALEKKALDQKHLAEQARDDMAKAARHYDRYSIFLDSAERLRAASTHWLRHTFGTEFVESGKGQLKTAQKVLGHAQITTTQVYVKTDTYQALREVEAFMNSSLLAEDQPSTEEEAPTALPSPLSDAA